MAYPKACVIMQHEMGRVMSAAYASRAKDYATARYYQSFGLVAKANQLRRQADKRFTDIRDAQMNKLEVNGCL